MRAAMRSTARVPHPVVWTILYFPFGALGGFVTVALTFLATRHGLSITEGAMLGGAQMVSQWLKWTWAPVIDITLTPKRWYLIGTSCSALGVFGMAAMPLSPETLWWLLAIVAVASLLNSIVGMSIEAIMAAVTPVEEQGRTSAWFQAGNLGGAGFGGGLGLLMLQYLPQPWMSGAILGILFMCCGLALLWVPDVSAHDRSGGVVGAVGSVFRDVWAMAGTKGGLLAAFLCFMPLGTGAAQATLTQAAVAAHWGAGEREVALVQGFLVGGITMIGCFGGGWLCDRLRPRTAYALIGLVIGAITTGMALTPHTVTAYVVWNLVYAYGVGLAYAAFTAVVLSAIGAKSAATKYTLYASLSNFPIFWLGLVLGRIADLYGPDRMLLAEAGFGVIAVLLFAGVSWLVGRTRLPDVLEEQVIDATLGHPAIGRAV
jgi:MFS transporter, PAT family, beta-lactamase induction signal transducer AmpG